MRTATTLLIVFAALACVVTAGAQTTLVAGTGTAVMDGDLGEWTSDPLMTARNVEIRAMATLVNGLRIR
jgi:hypothetical protein